MPLSTPVPAVHYGAQKFSSNQLQFLYGQVIITFTLGNRALTDGFPVRMMMRSRSSCHYILLNNGILKSNSSIFPRSEGYITQYTPWGVYGLIVNENNEVSISLGIVKII